MSILYSEHGQDQWIIEEVFKGLQGGYFIDIGASDGVESSNTYLLEKDYGWQGICVEPRILEFEKLALNRDCICENVCIAETYRPIVPFAEGGGDSSGILAHFSDAKVLEQGQKKVIFRKCLTLDYLLKKHQAPQIIHYLSIDTEGAEYEILKTFDFTHYRILALTLEHNAQLGEKNFLKRQQIHKLLQQNGYYFCKTLGADDGFLLSDYQKYI